MSKSAKRKLPCASKLFDFSVVWMKSLGDWTGGANRDRTDDLKLAKLALSQLSYGPVVVEIGRMVGLGRLELPTSRLSSARSNQLSYKPDEASSAAHGLVPMCATEKGRETRAAARRHFVLKEDVGISS